MIALSEGIQLYSGAFFSYTDPESSEVSIEDIARALSHVCRFSGHVRHFYSVAQHAVNASFLVPPEFAYDALMHDMSEAFTNDLPTPLKHAVPALKDLEVRIETAMAERFGFRFPLPPEVKKADLQMLLMEKEELKPHAAGDWQVLDGISVTERDREVVDLTEWSPTDAYDVFMYRYGMLEQAR